MCRFSRMKEAWWLWVMCIADSIEPEEWRYVQLWVQLQNTGSLISIALNSKSNFCNQTRSTKASGKFIYIRWLCVALNSIVAPNFKFLAVALRTYPEVHSPPVFARQLNKQPRRLRQKKRRFKINIYEMMTILWLLLFARILYFWQIKLQMVW